MTMTFYGRGAELWFPSQTGAVRHLAKELRERIYEGMLIYSKQYVEEHSGNDRNVRLYRQGNNGGVWAICKVNQSPTLGGELGTELHRTSAYLARRAALASSIRGHPLASDLKDRCEVA